MNKLEIEKAKIKILDEYRKKNDNRAKEYFFTLDMDSAAKLDFILDTTKETVTDCMLGLAANNFDGAVVYSLCKDKPEHQMGIEDFLRKLMRGEL